MLLFVHFNPRIHVGYDDEVGTKMALNSRFQSTQPRRVRLSQIVFMTCLKNISNHTLSQDATVECCKAGYIRFISIHTSARDATAIINKSHHKKQYIWYNPHIPLIKDSFIGFSTPIWLTKLILFWCESIRKFSCAIGSHLFL